MMFRLSISLPQIGIQPERIRREEIKRLCKNMGKWIIREIETKWVTDPGRPYRRVRVRRTRTRTIYERDLATGQVVERQEHYVVGGYRKVPIYPRSKIGVVTGRLRASIGANWQGDELGGGVYNERDTGRGYMVEIGTNVKYANVLRRRKYDFLERGLNSAFEIYGDREIESFLNRLLGGVI